MELGKERKQGKRAEGEEGGGTPALQPVLSRPCRVSSLHPDSALCPAHRRCSVSVVELSQVSLGNQVSEEEKVGRMRKVEEGQREVGRSRSRTNKREGEVRTDGGMERKRPVAMEVAKEEGG